MGLTEKGLTLLLFIIIGTSVTVHGAGNNTNTTLDTTTPPPPPPPPLGSLDGACNSTVPCNGSLKCVQNRCINCDLTEGLVWSPTKSQCKMRVGGSNCCAANSCSSYEDCTDHAACVSTSCTSECKSRRRRYYYRPYYYRPYYRPLYLCSYCGSYYHHPYYYGGYAGSGGTGAQPVPAQPTHGKCECKYGNGNGFVDGTCPALGLTIISPNVLALAIVAILTTFITSV